ncbi:MAG: Asp23/Gls24 family envelope stress response protein [Candidatus Sumerlaeota bacterium]
MSSAEKPAHSPISKEDSESLSIGRIEIGDDVIATIAARAAAKVKGISVVGSSFRWSELLGSREHGNRGVSVQINENTGHVIINLDVNVAYGVTIYEAAHKLQMLIKEEVEALTGSLNVDKVNVRVNNVVVEEELDGEEPLRPDQAVITPNES